MATRPMFALVLLAVLLVLLVGLAAPAFASDKLNLFPNPETFAARIVLFIGLVFITNALIFKPIFAALDDRTRRVAGARQRAEEVEEESDALLQRYESSIREVRADADTDRKNHLGHAREEQLRMAEAARAQAETKVEQARSELDAALLGAREGLNAASREIARAVATRVIGRDL
ncbi:MAG: ATP synthase F0 subunit B [Myxococcota bacterium]|nr:ATP synthase F0 subunit B [Myxococcota bacterium]